MDLILKCIHNHPKSRAHASEIGKKLAKMLLQFPAPFPNRLEMMHQLEAERKKKSALIEEREEKTRVIQRKEDEIALNRQKLQDEKRQISEIERLKGPYSSEMEQLQLQIRDLNTENKLLQAENEAEMIEIKSKVEALEDQVENGDKSLFEFKTQLAKERQKFKEDLAKEREGAEKLMVDLSKSQLNTIFLQGAISNLQCDLKGKDATITRKDSEIEAKSRAL